MHLATQDAHLLNFVLVRNDFFISFLQCCFLGRNFAHNHCHGDRQSGEGVPARVRDQPHEGNRARRHLERPQEEEARAPRHRYRGRPG